MEISFNPGDFYDNVALFSLAMLRFAGEDAGAKEEGMRILLLLRDHILHTREAKSIAHLWPCIEGYLQR